MTTDLYLVVALLKKAEHDEGAQAKIVMQPMAVIASDEAQACLRAMKKFLPEMHRDNDRLEVRAIPFR